MSDHHPCATGLKSLYGCLAGLALLAAGCSHSGDTEDRGRAFTPVFTPLPPPFLTGPMAALLTNRSGYAAQLDAQTEAVSERERSVSGQLLCRGSKLFFAPESSGGSKQKARGGTFNFIWDVANNSGYVLSEALQGYAPVSAQTVVTNVVQGAEADSARQVQGHVCQQQRVTFELSNGFTNEYEVLRAKDLKGFPVELISVQGSNPLVITLSQIRFETPPENLFSPPDSFAKYDSPEAMVDELAMRQRLLRRRN